MSMSEQMAAEQQSSVKRFAERAVSDTIKNAKKLFKKIIEKTDPDNVLKKEMDQSVQKTNFKINEMEKNGFLSKDGAAQLRDDVQRLSEYNGKFDRGIDGVAGIETIKDQLDNMDRDFKMTLEKNPDAKLDTKNAENDLLRGSSNINDEVDRRHIARGKGLLKKENEVDLDSINPKIDANMEKKLKEARENIAKKTAGRSILKDKKAEHKAQEFSNSIDVSQTKTGKAEINPTANLDASTKKLETSTKQLTDATKKIDVKKPQTVVDAKKAIGNTSKAVKNLTKQVENVTKGAGATSNAAKKSLEVAKKALEAAKKALEAAKKAVKAAVKTVETTVTTSVAAAWPVGTAAAAIKEAVKEKIKDVGGKAMEGMNKANEISDRFNGKFEGKKDDKAAGLTEHVKNPGKALVQDAKAAYKKIEKNGDDMCDRKGDDKGGNKNKQSSNQQASKPVENVKAVESAVEERER